jgi:hypothetical protein
MKTLLKPFAFLLALPVALVVVLMMALQGCKRAVVCDPVHPPGTNDGAGNTDPNAGPANNTFIPPTYPRICDPVHVPPPAEKK